MSRSLGQNYGTTLKVLLQGMHICNVKALSLLEAMTKVKAFLSDPNSKVKITRSKILVLMERSCHKNTYVKNVWSAYSSSVIGKVKIFVYAVVDPDAGGTTTALRTFVPAS